MQRYDAMPCLHTPSWPPPDALSPSRLSFARPQIRRPQWEEYLKLLKERPDGQIGRRMSQEEVGRSSWRRLCPSSAGTNTSGRHILLQIAQLSDDQREQLAMLKSEAKKE